MWFVARTYALGSLLVAPRSSPPVSQIEPATEWASARAGAGTLVWSAPSAAFADTQVQVREHRDGWHTLGFAAPTGFGVQSVCKVVDGRADAHAVASDYLHSMAAVALAATARATPPGGGAPLRLLCLGMGGGTLPQLLGAACPDSLESGRIRAVELDGAVAEAAVEHLGLDRRVRVETADARQWLRRHAASLGRPSYPLVDPDAAGAACDAVDDERLFDAILVDVFDGRNHAVDDFCSAGFLSDCRRSLSARGCVVHNLHSGGAALDARLAAAAAAYRDAFPAGSCALVPARGPGNTLVAGGIAPRLFERAEELREAADAERARRGLRFDAAGRLGGLRVVR